MQHRRRINTGLFLLRRIPFHVHAARLQYSFSRWRGIAAFHPFTLRFGKCLTAARCSPSVIVISRLAARTYVTSKIVKLCLRCCLPFLLQCPLGIMMFIPPLIPANILERMMAKL